MESKVEALGPTGTRVAKRLNEIRRDRGLTLGELADKVRAVGRPILLSALSKIEKGQRRVDADDLVALALALDVSPHLLLFPDDASPATPVDLTSSITKDALDTWHWATRDVPPALSSLTWDFFISYTQPDKAWANWVASVLQRSGYSVWFDEWQIGPGDNWVFSVNQALRQSDCVITILSPAFNASTHALREAIAARNRPHRALLPVLVADCDPPPSLREIAYLDLRDANAEQAADRLLRYAARLTRKAAVEPKTAAAFPGRETP